MVLTGRELVRTGLPFTGANASTIDASLPIAAFRLGHTVIVAAAESRVVRWK